MRLQFHFIFLAIAFLFGVCFSAYGRQWQSADGSKTFEGILIGYAPPSITISRSDGQKITFDESKLSDADRAYCRANGPMVKPIIEQSIAKGSFRIISVGTDGILCEQILNRYQSALAFERLAALGDLEAAKVAAAGKGEVFWVWHPDTTTLADGQISTSDLYWAGSYSYTTAAGTRSTVRSFAGYLEEAIDILDRSRKQKKNAQMAEDDSRSKRQPIPAENHGSSGTAFAITDKGHLVTNAHVIEGGKSLKVKYPGGLIPVKVLAVDAVNDLAILKLEGETTPLLFEAANAKAGDDIMAAGFPNPTIQGSTIKLTRGIISSTKGMQDDARHFQIDAAMQPGNSGGPILNMEGKVLGIAVAKLRDSTAIQETGSVPQNVNYAIKLDYLTPLIKTVEGLQEAISAQKPNASSRTTGEKAEASTYLLINEGEPIGR
jgi:S1-C subfamily serine protease